MPQHSPCGVGEPRVSGRHRGQEDKWKRGVSDVSVAAPALEGDNETEVEDSEGV